MAVLPSLAARLGRAILVRRSQSRHVKGRLANYRLGKDRQIMVKANRDLFLRRPAVVGVGVSAKLSRHFFC